MSEPEFKNVLPEDHYISRYIEYCKSLTDAYPEYHFVSALQQLSVVVNRRLFINLRPEGFYPNLWNINVGNSTTSRKTTALRISNRALAGGGLDERKIPDEFSLESLISNIAETPRGYFVRDELGGLFIYY
jgi:hypothetical protein